MSSLKVKVFNEKKAHIKHEKICWNRPFEEQSVLEWLPKDKLHIKGSPLFKIRVRRVLKKIKEETSLLSKGGSLAAYFFQSSERTAFDPELKILYIHHAMCESDIEACLCQVACLPEKQKSPFQMIHNPYHLSSKNTGRLSKWKRKHLRVSLEKRFEESVLRIIKEPPLGKVATEDQHFFMTMMKLEIFIKSIVKKIERNSVITLLEKERGKKIKALLSLHKGKLQGVDDLDHAMIVELKKNIKDIDILLFKKRLTIQKRLIKRCSQTVDIWKSGDNFQFADHDYKEKIDKTMAKIEKIDLFQDRIYENPWFKINSIRKIYLTRRLLNLKRKKIKYTYLVSFFERQNSFMHKLQKSLKKKNTEELISESYHSSWKAKSFDFLRFFINIIFMGFYVYIIRLPLVLAPFFMALGLYVFAPISNKFAILFLSPFIKNNGLKRLSVIDLKESIDRKAAGKRYLCAIDLPLYTGQDNELKTTLHYIQRNIHNLQETLCYYKNMDILYQITSNTEDPTLIEKEIALTQKAQHLADGLLGEKKIFFIYLHRSSSVAKKVGNIIAAHLFKYHGLTTPNIYIDPRRFLITFEKKPFFDRAYGNFKDSICKRDSGSELLENDVIIQEILSGNQIEINNRVEFSFFVDNKNEVKPASLEKALAIMLHPENSNIGILQPLMSIEDPVSEGQNVTSAFLRMMRISRDVHNERYLNTLHGLYHNMSAYYGKGMLRLGKYDDMVMNEILNLKYVDSHDWQESVFNHAVMAIEGETKVSALKKIEKEDQVSYDVLVEKRNESVFYHLCFKKDECFLYFEEGNCRKFKTDKKSSHEERIRSVINYLNNGVEVGERELISTIGHYMRDMRWLKGDLQMFHTFAPYRKSMPAYHRFHLENIFRRLSNEIALFAWVMLNLICALFFTSPHRSIEVVFVLTIYLAVTAFGFAGIDLFLYPIFFEVNHRVQFQPYSMSKSFQRSTGIILNKILIGTWQFILYLLIAWPRVFLGIKSAIKILFTGIDQPIEWAKFSNASISLEETSKKGIPLKRFFYFYWDCLFVGMIMLVFFMGLVLFGQAPISIFMPLHMGIIVSSLILGPLVSYLISKRIQIS